MLLAPLQRAVSCVSPAVLLRVDDLPGLPATIMFPSTDAVRLIRSTGWRLRVAQNYELISHRGARPRWEARTTGYAYELQRDDRQPVLSWHWHPTALSPAAWPHLHVHGGVAGVDLSKAHLAMGPVTLPSVLRGAIMDLGVVPRRGDWRAVLEGAIAALEAAEPS